MKDVPSLKNTNTGRFQKLQSIILYAPFVIAVVLLVSCVVIEILQVPITKEMRDQIYSTFGTISYYTAILLTMVYGRRYGLGWIRSLIFSFLSFRLVFNLISVGWKDLDLMLFDTAAVASYRSIIFLPLLCLILSRFCKLDTMNLCDYLTPYFFFHHGVVTLPCWIEGCCAGKPWSWGLLNPLSGMTVFPTQPCIVILSVAVAYWGLRFSKKHEYRANGLVFANSIIIYGFFRYLIELFTDDPRVFWVLSWLSVCSLIMIAQGLLVRWIVRKRTKTP